MMVIMTGISTVYGEETQSEENTAEVKIASTHDIKVQYDDHINLDELIGAGYAVVSIENESITSYKVSKGAVTDTKDTSIITTSSIYLLMCGINIFSKSANIIVGNGIRGSGDTKWMLYTQLFGTVSVAGVAALFVYVCKFGITGVFLAVLVDEAVRALINMWKYLRIVKTWEERERIGSMCGS